MRETARYVAWIGASIVGVLGLAGCGPVEPLPSDAVDAWERILSGHTSGIVSRKSQIHVLFAADVAPQDAAAVEAAVRVEPHVTGDVELRGARELVLTPAYDLQPGREYRVTLDPRFAGIAAATAPYAFTFRVQIPQFDAIVQQLESDPADDRRMSLRGRIVTADVESAESVEQILRARFAGAALAAAWAHSSNGRDHYFTLTGIEQQQAAEDLALSLDGAPIGSSRNEQRRVRVPAREQFVVTGAQGVEDGDRNEIRVWFSSALDAGQDLTGLVRLSSGAFTTRISANALTLYPAVEPAGGVTVTIEQGIRDARGRRLEATAVHTLTFASEKPQVRFVGSGAILPAGETLTVPFEALNARSVRVVATRVFPENLPQFLQVNSLDGTSELGRVGRHLWRKTLPLGGPVTGRWQRYDIDVTELVSRYPGSLFQLSLQLTRADSAYPCANDAEPAAADTPAADLRNQESGDVALPSSWDFAENWFGVSTDENGNYDYAAQWRDRGNPCTPAYYRFAAGTRAQRNVLTSNIGLLAKSDRLGKLLVSVTDLRTARPKARVALSVRNYQNQVLAVAMSDVDGLATFEVAGTPFLLIADDGEQRGYLKLSAGTALPTSHFDVGGEAVSAGLKGFIYGERGVWRPGEAIPLTFVVHDRDKTLPADHPATLEVADPRGRIAQTIVNAAPVDGFYRFDVGTPADAPTGDWTATVTLGGATFKKTLKVETVMPNRLKVELETGDGTLVAGEAIRGSVRSEWLTGASAAGLEADVSVRLSATATRFERFTDYSFDDPAREFRGEPEELFAGELDAQGSVRFARAIQVGTEPPGMLRADFTTRVFERGGAFSIGHESRPLAPYSRFVGVRLPRGDVARGMLRTDEDHVVEIGVLDANGEPVSGASLDITVHKLEWRWWWDRSEDSLAQYLARSTSSKLREARAVTDADGRAQWTLRIEYPEWGRYLVRVCDADGGHCTGSTFYVDWPSWAGEEREQSGPAASMLSLSADKARYEVGETATVQLPESAAGRALVTVENGTGILDARWVTPSGGNTRIDIPITAAMTPNAYVAVTLVQPHEGKTNDRPIRLYGAVPLLVEDPATHLTPLIETEEEWRPESNVWVEVREAQGRPMTYTLAVVDEGLLSLTAFRTPDLHRELFKREALGVRTWDLYDDVIGAYGAELERLLALGGSDAGQATQMARRESRFPPVTEVLGPFRLEAGATARQEIALPRYVGAVRVMVVAGDNAGAPAAFGSAERRVHVRQPLMILPTMPRVIGPSEEVTVPISVFAMDESVRDVVLGVETDGLLEIVGDSTARVAFTGQGEKIAELRLRAAARLGTSRIVFTAMSAAHTARSDIAIEVRSSNPPTSRVQTKLIAPGDAWTTRIEPHGLAGTNRVTLEVSALPPLDLDNRLRYLIQYPHGCLEQTTSSVFPQLFLSSLVEVDADRAGEIERNVRSGIERLRLFQTASGGFTYWPGGTELATGSLEGYALWATTYASHFLVEAERLGYDVPASMRAGVLRSLRRSAQGWAGQSAAMDQAYRLYVLARAGEPEIGAMNRLREQASLGDVERWTLAAAYAMSGLREAARPLAAANALAVRAYAGSDYTFGSALRDHGLVLQAMVTLDELDRAEPLVRAISAELGTEQWYSTQAVAYSLLAMSQLAGARGAEPISFEQILGTARRHVTSAATVHQAELTGVPEEGRELTLRNTSASPLFATIAVRGIPAAQEEAASAEGLALEIRYSNDRGEPIDVAQLVQGTDVVADLEVRNTSGVAIDNIALTEIVPAGWEIHNERLAGAGAAADGERLGARPRPFDGSLAATAPRLDYLDLRDDRVLRYFSLRPGETIRFQTRVNAAYRGRYYLPSVTAEAMYDASTHAGTAGVWTRVVAR